MAISSGFYDPAALGNRSSKERDPATAAGGLGGRPTREFVGNRLPELQVDRLPSTWAGCILCDSGEQPSNHHGCNAAEQRRPPACASGTAHNVLRLHSRKMAVHLYMGGFPEVSQGPPFMCCMHCRASQWTDGRDEPLQGFTGRAGGRDTCRGGLRQDSASLLSWPPN